MKKRGIFKNVAYVLTTFIIETIIPLSEKFKAVEGNVKLTLILLENDLFEANMLGVIFSIYLYNVFCDLNSSDSNSGEMDYVGIGEYNLYVMKKMYSIDKFDKIIVNDELSISSKNIIETVKKFLK